MSKPLFRKIDCHMLRVPDLDAGIAFYSGVLGQSLIWRSAEAAGLAMPETDAELVLHTELRPQTDLLVEAVDDAFARILAAGGSSVEPPFDIAIGRCAVLRDPFGNILTILDQSKGVLATDKNKQVRGVEERR